MRDPSATHRGLLTEQKPVLRELLRVTAEVEAQAEEQRQRLSESLGFHPQQVFQHLLGKCGKEAAHSSVPSERLASDSLLAFAAHVIDTDANCVPREQTRELAELLTARLATRGGGRHSALGDLQSIGYEGFLRLTTPRAGVLHSALLDGMRPSWYHQEHVSGHSAWDHRQEIHRDVAVQLALLIHVELHALQQVCTCRDALLASGLRPLDVWCFLMQGEASDYARLLEVTLPCAAEYLSLRGLQQLLVTKLAWLDSPDQCKALVWHLDDFGAGLISREQLDRFLDPLGQVRSGEYFKDHPDQSARRWGPVPPCPQPGRSGLHASCDADLASLEDSSAKAARPVAITVPSPWVAQPALGFKSHTPISPFPSLLHASRSSLCPLRGKGEQQSPLEQESVHPSTSASPRKEPLGLTSYPSWSPKEVKSLLPLELKHLGGGLLASQPQRPEGRSPNDRTVSGDGFGFSQSSPSSPCQRSSPREMESFYSTVGNSKKEDLQDRWSPLSNISTMASFDDSPSPRSTSAIGQTVCLTQTPEKTWSPIMLHKSAQGGAKVGFERSKDHEERSFFGYKRGHCSAPSLPSSMAPSEDFSCSLALEPDQQTSESGLPFSAGGGKEYKKHHPWKPQKQYRLWPVQACQWCPQL